MSQRVRLAIAVLACAALGIAAFVYLHEVRRGPASTASGRPLEGLCGGAVRAVCAKRVECGRMDPSQLAACLEETAAECDRTLGWKLRAGVLSTGGEPQEECVEGLAGASCSALQFMLADDEPGLFELTSRCEKPELFVPHAGLGDPCAESSDCTAGYCPGLAPECHRCRAFVPEGEPCKAGVLECDPARARCAAAADGTGRCAALSADGAPCTVPQECRSGACRPAASGAGRACAAAPAGTACRDSADCESTSYCRGAGAGASGAGGAAGASGAAGAGGAGGAGIVAGAGGAAGASGAAGTCAPRAKTSEACTGEAGSCAESEAACVAGRCQVRPFALREGERCLEFTDCKPGLYCKGARGGTGAGVCAPQAAAGETCAPLDFGNCAVDAACLGSHCRKLRGPGEACGAPFQCKSFLSCVPSSLSKGFAGGATCVADALPGEECNQHRPCTASYCDAGRCVARAPGGQACRVNEQCVSGWCVPGAAGGTCYAPCADTVALSPPRQRR